MEGGCHAGLIASPRGPKIAFVGGDGPAHLGFTSDQDLGVSAVPCRIPAQVLMGMVPVLNLDKHRVVNETLLATM